MKKHMPEFGSAKNPVDLTGMAGTEWYYDATKAAYPHPWVDGLVVLYCETAVSDPLEIAKGIKRAVDEAGVNDKPVCVSFVGGERSEAAMAWLVENGIPAYGAPGCRHQRHGCPARICADERNCHGRRPVAARPDNREQAMKIIEKARAEKRDSLTEIEAKEVFAAYGLPVATTELAKTEDEAVKLAYEIGYPVVMKIVSPDILHKSDAGGVKVNIKDENGVREAFRTILKNAKAYKENARIHGIAIQEMAPWGTEVILGSVNDPTFGPTMMFGLGGIFVEVLKDVTFRVAPVATEPGRAHAG